MTTILLRSIFQLPFRFSKINGSETVLGIVKYLIYDILSCVAVFISKTEPDVKFTYCVSYHCLSFEHLFTLCYTDTVQSKRKQDVIFRLFDAL